jgi:hypothetical protein
VKRLLIAGALLIGMLGTQATTAGAAEYFCDWDPPVLIVTPGGNLESVYVSVWTSSPLNIGLPVENYKATRAYDSHGQPVTDVDVAVYVPSGLLFKFTTLNMVSTGLLGGGERLATAYGTSGQTTHLRFRLNEP